MTLTTTTNYMPGPGSPYRWDFTPTDAEKDETRKRFADNFIVPLNFTQTVEPFNVANQQLYGNQPKAQLNPQTTTFCDTLGIDDPVGVLMLMRGEELNHSTYTDSYNSTGNESSASLNQSNLTSDSSFNTTSEFTPKKIRTEFILPSPHNNSFIANPDELQIDEDDDDADFIIEDSTEINSSILNSTVSSSFSHTSFSPPPYKMPSTAEMKQDYDEVTAMLSEQAKILSPPLVRKVPNDLEEKNTSTEEATKRSESNESNVPAKKFKRRNEAIYAANDD